MFKLNKFSVIILLGMLLILLVGGPNYQSARAESDIQNRVAISVGLIPDAGGINDHSFNQMANEGLERAELDLEGINGTVYPTTTSDDYVDQITQCVTDGNKLCITVGFQMAGVTKDAALAHSGVKFAIVDVTYETYPDNLRGISFAVEEAAYLAGTLAGQMTNSKVIGVIGGMPIPPVEAFILPYQYAAHWANPENTVMLDYAYNFIDPDLGAQLAQDQMAHGADVIFGVGGPMGNGAILDAAQVGAWVIGADVDVWVSVFGENSVDGSEYVLTSVLKRVDNAVYYTINDLANSISSFNRSFTGGTVVYGLADEGVGLAPYHEAETLIPGAVKDNIDAIAQSIIAGEIDIWEPFYSHLIYLPLTMK